MVLLPFAHSSSLLRERFFAIPIYWIAIRKRLFGGQLLLVEQDGPEESEARGIHGPASSLRPKFASGPPSRQIQPGNVAERLRLWLTSTWVTAQSADRISRPRLGWEASFLKTVALFSVIGIVNLGFERLDFG